MSPTRKSACDLLNLVMLRHLRFFGHVIRSDPDEYHTRALNAGVNDPQKEWRRPRGCPHQTWLRTIENDFKHQTWNCGRPGTELMIVICGVILWKWRRSCRGMLHDYDDDDDDDDDDELKCNTVI